MCSHYQGIKKRERLERYFRVHGIELPPNWEQWPDKPGVFVRRPPEWESGDEAVPQREAVVGRWGLISSRTRLEGLARAQQLSTHNAKSETASTAYTFSHAWRHAQRCIVPADAIFEPDHRDKTKAALGTTKAVPTRFVRADGAPMGIAGLWDRYRDAAGHWIETYTMLTISAEHHPLFRLYHRLDKPKRMVVILPDDCYGDWLTADAVRTRDFLLPYPADALVAEPQRP